jgi:aminoglycoside phosphotransferase (APT) family kinase protein
MVDTLADLHAVDIEAHGLAVLGKPAGFVARQVHGWSERWRGSQTRELGEMEALARWLSEHLPLDRGGYSLVHGDYKLDNVMLDAHDISRVVGVFDWEMSAVGDPLVDVGIFLCYWIHTLPASERDDLTTVTNLPGWYTRAEIIDRYATRTGRDLTDIKFYEVLALFKLAVILQQIFYRYARGQTDDARFAALDERVIWLARLAAKLVEGD